MFAVAMPDTRRPAAPVLASAPVITPAPVLGGVLVAVGVGVLVCSLILMAVTPAQASGQTVAQAAGQVAQAAPAAAQPSGQPGGKGPAQVDNPWFSGVWTTGLGVGTSTSIYKGADDEVGPLPILSFDSERLHIGLDGVAVKVLGYGDVSVSAMLGYAGAPFEPKDSPMLRGLKKRKGAIEGGIAIDYDSPIGGFSLTYKDALNDAHDGMSVDLAYAYQYQQDRWYAGFTTGVTWQSGDLVDYHVGVKTSEARADRKAYKPGDAILPHFGISAGYALNSSKSLWLDAGIEATMLPKEYTDSPIVDADATIGGMMAIRYQF